MSRIALPPLSVLLLFWLLLCQAFSPQSGAALEVPKLAGRINDHASLLSPQSVADLEKRLADLEASDSTQIVVLTIPSLQGESLEEYSLKVAETWGIGRKDVDNGALLLVARDDRKLRIETGYGLEGRLTDVVAGRIIRQVITPRFKQGKFDQGISDGVEAMIQAVKGELSVKPNVQSKRNGTQPILAPLMTWRSKIRNSISLSTGNARQRWESMPRRSKPPSTPPTAPVRFRLFSLPRISIR